MLYRLEIANFYSVRDRQVIDLRIGDSVPDVPGRFDPLFPGSKERAPRVVAFFGPNASGKSTVLKALAFVLWFVRDSFQRQPNVGIPCECFNDTAAQAEPVRLAIEFGGPLDPAVEPGSAPIAYGTWRYELALFMSDGRFIVTEENLHQRANGRGRWTRVFERENDQVSAGKVFALSGYSKVIDKVRDNASLISTLAQFDHVPSLRLSEAARSVVANILADRTEVGDDAAIKYYAADTAAMEELNRDIQRIDLGIKKMIIVQGQAGPLALFEHEGLERPMPWALESHGTRTFIRNLPLLQIALARGSMSIVDEIDLAIHPLVLPEIIRWFHDPERNPQRAQLWMSCHAATLLEDLQKEEVFFCEKDTRGRTKVYGLQDIRNARRADNRYRRYMSGMYGAIPQIG
ncbi:abortive infection protein [Rhodoplanes elegans]|uniref:Abortive infection protein n=1 Tax=Rhodoplanes elegans TaxID=29408 RepID=A0A327K5L3_9BRAD|nr:ATP-binding protein [Rhodoplanes elegans]MBK5957795.1 abortive infection protein [Rhodoplanes elegans]RAI33196.1 abortive infection protein [Rhodoplanes elegans]